MGVSVHMWCGCLDGGAALMTWWVLGAWAYIGWAAYMGGRLYIGWWWCVYIYRRWYILGVGLVGVTIEVWWEFDWCVGWGICVSVLWVWWGVLEVCLGVLMVGWLYHSKSIRYMNSVCVCAVRAPKVCVKGKSCRIATRIV